MSMPTTGLASVRGHGDNANVLERTIDASYPNNGYVDDMPLPFSDWLLATGATPGVTPDAASVVRGLALTYLPVFRWGATAQNETADTLITSIVVPGTYNPDIDQLYLVGAFRKVDLTGSATDNTDLAITVQMRQIMPGNASPSISSTTVPSTATTPATLVAGETALTAMEAVITRTLPAAAVATSGGFYDIQFDLGANVRSTAAQLIATDAPTRATVDYRKVKPLDILVLEVAVNEAVGTNLNVECAGFFLRHFRHASLHNRDRRFSLDGGALTRVDNGVAAGQYIR